jgi:AcrR family transcriptional regulator
MVSSTVVHRRREEAVARKTRTDWLDAGIDVLATEGVDALTIDHLAEGLGVTKGSFYHHFKSQADYRDALLAFWEQWGMQYVTPQEQSVSEALGSLDLVVASSPIGAGGGDPGMAIRFWATRDPKVRAFVERVDDRRLRYVEDLLTVVVGERERAAFLSRMLYALILGSGHIVPPVDHSVMLDFYEQFKRLLQVSRQA